MVWCDVRALYLYVLEFRACWSRGLPVVRYWLASDENAVRPVFFF